MRVLFDQGTPVPLRPYLSSHSVSPAYEMGWSTLSNGALLAQAQADGFKVLVTTDQNLKYQQVLQKRTIAVVVLLSTSWPKIQMRIKEVVDAIDGVQLSDYVEVAI